MEPEKDSTTIVTPLAEVLRMALHEQTAEREPASDESIELLLLTRAEHLARIASHLACVRWLDMTGHAVVFSTLQPALQHYYRQLAERAAKSVDPEIVSLAIAEAVRVTLEDRARGVEVDADWLCREAIYQFISVMAEPKDGTR